jgi:hypothetical protein
LRHRRAGPSQSAQSRGHSCDLTPSSVAGLLWSSDLRGVVARSNPHGNRGFNHEHLHTRHRACSDQSGRDDPPRTGARSARHLRTPGSPVARAARHQHGHPAGRSARPGGGVRFRQECDGPGAARSAGRGALARHQRHGRGLWHRHGRRHRGRATPGAKGPPGRGVSGSDDLAGPDHAGR